MNGKIYKITNTLNGKVYIGQTIRSIELRWNYHCSKSSECLKLKNAIQKYGKENFTIEQIDEAPSLDELNKKEEEWISFFNSVSCGYNLQSGGLNRIHSVESLKKMSDSILSRNKNPEFMKKFRASILKARQNPEYRKKKSQQEKQRTDDPKYRLAMGERLRKVFVPVIGVSISDGSVIEFESMHHAQRAGFHRFGIQQCANGVYAQHKGYAWSYKE